MIKGASLLPRAARNASIQAASRAFAASARVSQTPMNNTAGVDPRVLDGEVLLPKANMDRLCDWQSGLWVRLAAEVRNNPALADVKQKWDKDGLDIVHLLDKSARDPALGLAFNYASLLLNNSYFLEGMTSSETATRYPESYGVDTAKRLTEKLQAYSEGIVGGAWLWLVRVGNNNHDLDIIPTFASGTLLVSQRYQNGRDDNPLFLAPSTATPHTSKPKKAAPAAEESTIPLNQATTGELKTSAKKQQYKPAPTASKDRITPLAVLNLYETAWLGEKYGVWDKQKYAADWFKTLNWTKVIERGTK